MNKKAAIITAYDPHKFKGGIEVFTLQLLALLKDHNIDADIFTIEEIGNEYKLHNSFVGRLYALGRKLYDSHLKYDFIISNSYYGFGCFPSKGKAFNIYHSTHAGFSEGIKAVVPPVTYLELKHLYGELLESSSGFNRDIIAVSENVADELKRYYGFENVRVINNGIDTSVFSPSDKLKAKKNVGIPENAYVGLYVGRWDLTKGSDILEAVMTSQKASDIYWLVVAGTGTDMEMLPKLHNIKVFEHIEHEKMPEVYNAADFVVFPSLYESFGYVIIEALACGVPVITTKVGVAKAIYRHEPFRQILLPDFKQGRKIIIDSCSEKISLLREDENLIKKISLEGRALVEKQFSLSRWRQEMRAHLGISSS